MANMIVCVNGCEVDGNNGIVRFTMHVVGLGREVSSAAVFTPGATATVINNAVQAKAQSLAAENGFPFGGSDKINVIGGAV